MNETRSSAISGALVEQGDVRIHGCIAGPALSGAGAVLVDVHVEVQFVRGTVEWSAQPDLVIVQYLRRSRLGSDLGLV